MVNGLWRHYNEDKQCGMCDDSRYLIANNIKGKQTKESKQLRRLTTMAFMKFKSLENESKLHDPGAPKIDEDAWNEIADISECLLFKSVKHLSHKQLIYLLQHYFIDQLIQNEDIKPVIKDNLA
eukprot:187516_1